MKKCTYCGKEYPDDATTCPIDGESLPKSDQELLAMFATPADYLPEALNKAAEELNKRNIDTSHLWTIVRPALSKRASQINKRKSNYFRFPGLIILIGCAVVQGMIYNQYNHEPLSFYFSRGIDPSSPLAVFYAIRQDYQIYIVYLLLTLGICVGLILVTIGECYYTAAKGYAKTLGFLPLLSIIIGVIIGILSHGGHGAALGLLIALAIAVILAMLPDKTKKSEP